jgi:branched-chain amino acid aminotransferase
MNGLVALNGKIVMPQDASISVLDRGFLFGDQVFEVLVAFGPKILDVEAHLTRLRRSAEILNMSIPWSDAELSFELQALVDQLGLPKAALRLCVTRGEGLGVKPPAAPKPNRIVYAYAPSAERPGLYQEGMTLKRLSLGYTDRHDTAKAGANYLRSIMALDQAGRAGFDDVLWTNADGEITEASTANIFLLERQGDNVAFVTPPINSGILAGITRATMIKLLGMAKIPVREELVYADELARFDEAFVCSTVRGLVPVQAIDKHRLVSARPQSVFRHIERLFLTWAETQIGHRVEWPTGARAKT